MGGRESSADWIWRTSSSSPIIGPLNTHKWWWSNRREFVKSKWIRRVDYLL
jgi:hypothetical protein